MIDNPVIKSFMHKGKFFIYTPYTNHILRITKKHYEEIKKLEHLGFQKYILQNSEKTDSYSLKRLIQSGFITNSFINAIKHPITDDYAVIVNRHISRLILQVTQRCNFSCRYCHDAQPGCASTIDGESDMSWNIAKQSIDFLIEHSQDSEIINIYFYGGEPLLNFDIIQRVVEYTEERLSSKCIIYRITTNGSLLTRDMATFFYLYRFKIAISLDGPKQRQNWHRKYVNGDDTFDIVWKNVQMLRSIYGDYFNEDIVFLPVRFEDEDKKFVLDFFYSYDIGKDQIFFLNANTSGVDYSSGVLHTENTVVGYNMEVLLDPDDEQKLMDDFVTKLENKHAVGKNWHHAGPCVPGLYKLFVNTNGSFYPCERISNHSDICIGNVYSGIDVERAVALTNIGKLTENECINCWAMRFCRICLVDCIDEEECCISKSVKQLHCDAHKKRALRLLTEYIDETCLEDKDDNG